MNTKSHFFIFPLTLFLGVCACALTMFQVKLAYTQNWGCYDPKPGHPTNAEKTSFVNEIRVYTQEAERTYGTPAAALIAMASVEGGYGWTRTALNANNIFGFKYSDAKSPCKNGECWILECQPKEDKNNRYVAFHSRRDAILFVAEKLATLKRYKPATEQYKSDLIVRE